MILTKPVIHICRMCGTGNETISHGKVGTLAVL